MARSKSNNPKSYLAIRIDKETRDNLQQFADAMGVSLNTYAALRLQQIALIMAK